MVTKTCNTCNLTLDISNFYKQKESYYERCKKCEEELRKCKHGIRKTRCDKCGGSEYCKHKKQKCQCKKCGGSQICEHKNLKAFCKKCNGSALCEHNTRKSYCIKCKGSQICEHNTRKSRCKKCKGSQICKHGQIKGRCHICGGNSLCIHCKMIQGRSRYVESLDKKVRCCAGCFYNFYPNDEIPRRYKLKQHYFNEKLIEEFGADFFQYDKKIKCGCSGRMPDWFIDCYKYSIIIELDEDQHKYTSCDDKRMMELFTDLGNRPLVLIRINPDKYEGRTKKRKGCFDFDEKNTLICDEKKFNKRFNILVEMIKYFIDNEPEKEITTEKLFFDRK